MHIHDYFIISQNKQDNFSLCIILDYHLACSDHDERVAKVEPAMRITDLEAKSKGKCRAASFFILCGVWRLSITYSGLVMSERACAQTQCKHKPTARPPNSFSQPSCIPVLTGGSLTLL